MMIPLLICFMLIALPLRAEPVAVPVAGPGADQVAGPVADPVQVLRARIAQSPARFEKFAAAIILDYGGANGVNSAGIETCLAVRRTRIRVRELRRLMLADLNGDAVLHRDEIAAMSGSATRLGSRGLWRAFSQADGNGDGEVSFDEMRSYAERVVARRFSAGDAAAIRSVMALDHDRDGFVTTAELQLALERLVPES